MLTGERAVGGRLKLGDRGLAPDGWSESWLVACLRRRDEDAYREMIKRFGARMLGVARRMLRSEEEARDAFQDACLNAFRSIEGFREGSSLATWLHRIVVNGALMRLRSARRRPEVDLERLLPTFDESGRHRLPVEPFSLAPEAALGRREVRTRVRACIDELPPRYRAVLVMRDIEELDTAETAVQLEISENAVKIRLHRARQALATLLARQPCDSS